MPKEYVAMSAARMNLDQFLEWADATPGRWQLEDGFAAALGPAPMARGVIHAAFGALLDEQLRDVRPDCHVSSSCGIVPHVRGAYNIRVAHLGVYDHPARHSVRYASDPLLVAMIVSPDNERQAWSNVWTFTSVPSIQEIVVVQAFSVQAEILRRGANGAWPGDFVPVARVMQLDSVGARVSLPDLYRGIDLTDV